MNTNQTILPHTRTQIYIQNSCKTYFSDRDVNEPISDLQARITDVSPHHHVLRCTHPDCSTILISENGRITSCPNPESTASSAHPSSWWGEIHLHHGLESRHPLGFGIGYRSEDWSAREKFGVYELDLYPCSKDGCTTVVATRASGDIHCSEHDPSIPIAPTRSSIHDDYFANKRGEVESSSGKMRSAVSAGGVAERKDWYPKRGASGLPPIGLFKV